MIQIFDALEQLGIGVEAPGQRRRLMQVLDVDRSGSVDLREFKRGLRIGNVEFHKQWKRGKVDTSDGKALTDTEKRMQEVRNRLHKVTTQDGSSSNSDQNVKGKIAPSTPGTMSISREDFLKQHSIKEELGLEHQYDEKATGISPTNLNTPKSSVLLGVPSPVVNEQVSENTGNRHLVTPKISQKRIEELQTKALMMQKALKTNPKDKVACAKYGYVLLEQGKYEEAISKLEQASSLGVDTARLWRSLGHAFFLTDRVDSSRSMFSKAERRHLSTEENRRKKFRATGETFEPRKVPLLMLYRWARTDMRRRNFKDAVDRLSSIVDQSPGQFDSFVQQQEVYISLGSCKYQLGCYAEALDWFQTAIMSRPGNRRKKNQNNASTTKRKKGKDTEENNSVSDKRLRSKRDSSRKGSRDKKQKDVDDKDKVNDEIAWKVGHLMKRAVQYIMARCYQQIGEPERGRVMLARAARRIPRRSITRLRQNNVGGSQGEKKLPTKSKNKKKSKTSTKIPQSVDFVSDDSGTSADELSADDDNLDSGTVDASNSADGTSNLLDPGLALKSKKGDLVAKFGAFWANRRHYELSIDMFRTALAADEHRQDWWTLLATCLKRQGKTADAVEAAERAHSLSSASGQGWKTMVSPFDTSNISSKMESWQKDREIYGDMIPSNPPSARSKSSKNRSRPSTAGSIRQPNNGVTKGPIQGLTNAQLEAAREENLKMEKRIIEEISRRMNETLSEKLDAFTKAVTPLKKRNNNNIHGKSGNFEYDEEEEESEVEAEEKEEEEFHQKKRKIRKRQSRHSDNDKKRSDLKETRQSLASGIENSIENSKKSWQSLSNSPKKSVRKKETVLSSVSLLSEEKQEAWIEEDSLTIDTQNPNDISDLASGAAYATAAAAASISSSSNAWASRSQNRLARVAQLAARATSALAEALRQASPSRTDENGFEKKDDSDNTIMPMFTPSQSLVMEDRMSEGQKPQGHPMEPTQTENLEVKDDIDPVPLPNITLNGIRDGSALRKDQNPVWREGRDFILIRRVFEEVSDTGNYKSGAVSKKAFLDALAKDFAVQEFIMGHPYNLIQPLLLRTQTFTPREGATVFEQTISMDTNERNIRWPDIEEQIRSLGGTTNAVGTAGHEVHDPYDPRFAYDGQRQRSQAEREERNATLQKKAELKQLRARQSEIDRKNREKDERIKQLSMSSLDTLGGYPGVDGVSILESTTDPRLQNSLMSQSSSLAYLDDNFVPVSAGGTLAQDSAYHNSVLPGDLDHELSWQYKGGDGRPPRPDETEEERRTRLEREEADFRRQRAAVEAELSVARTALAVRNLEAAQHIETVGRELKKRLEGKNGRSRTHELLNIRADAAAEISRLSADAKAIRNRVQEHIDKVDDILDIRRDSKANRRHNEAQAIAKMTLKNQKERRKRLKASRGEGDNSSSDSSSGEDTEDTSEALPGDGVMRLISRGGEAGSAAIFNASTSLAKSGHRNNSGKKKKKKDKKKGKRKNSDSNRRKKKIYVDSADPEMRMLFADYEHGTSVRQKIIQVRTVHKHISEEEAFLSLIECNSDVDKAIGKLTDVRFFRDLRTVSQLAKKAKPGEISYATATAMQKGSESRKQTKAVATDLPISKTGGETGSFAPAGRKELINTYDEWLKYRNAREATDENLMVQRVSFHNQKLSSLGDEKIEGLDVPQSHEEVTARDAAPSVNVSLTHSGSNLVSVLAKSSPYLVQPFRRKKPTRAQKRMFRKKSGHMADSFPAYIDGALKAETNWKKNGGMRRRLHGGGAAVRDVTKGKKRKHGAQGSGARAATAVSYAEYEQVFCSLMQRNFSAEPFYVFSVLLLTHPGI